MRSSSDPAYTCTVDGCDGSGNTNGTGKWHTSRRSCPLLKRCDPNFVACSVCLNAGLPRWFLKGTGIGKHFELKHSNK